MQSSDHQAIMDQCRKFAASLSFDGKSDPLYASFIYGLEATDLGIARLLIFITEHNFKTIGFYTILLIESHIMKTENAIAFCDPFRRISSLEINKTQIQHTLLSPFNVATFVDLIRKQI